MLAQKQKIAKNFNLSAKTYDNAARVQKVIGDNLFALLSDISLENKTVLDLASGTGYLLKKFPKALGVKTLVALDIAELSLKLSKKNHQHRSVSYITADFDCLPFLDNSFDLVISNMALQWSLSLDHTMKEIHRILKKGGNFAFSTLGEHTFQELEDLDPPIKRNSFLKMDTWRESMDAFCSNSVSITRKEILCDYSSFLDFAKELKAIGANTRSYKTRRGLNAKFRQEPLSVTYDVIYGLVQGVDK